MAQPATIEERLTAVEQSVAEVQRRLDRLDPHQEWIKWITGSMENMPEFEEVLRLGQEFRRTDQTS
jgi:hypothetical protein